MTEPRFPIEGGCLCSKTRYQIHSKPLAAYYCHCSMCRKNSGGGLFLASATVAMEHVSFVKGELSAYESSPGNLRLFCGVCGSPIGCRVATDPKLIELHLGCLDNPSLIRPTFHMHVGTQVEWCGIEDGLPRHEERAPELDELWVQMEGWSQQ